jgi:hypothetical protein
LRLISEIVFLTTLALRLRCFEVREEGGRGGGGCATEAARRAEECALMEAAPQL